MGGSTFATQRGHRVTLQNRCLPAGPTNPQVAYVKRGIEMTRATRKEAPRSRVYPVKILAIDQFLPVLMTILIASLVDHIHNHSHNQSRLKFIFTIFIPDFKNILSLFDSGFQEFWGEKKLKFPCRIPESCPWSGRRAGTQPQLRLETAASRRVRLQNCR